MDRKRVYHPETNEPFDLPEAKANKLVLEQGWLQTPIDPEAVPAVTTVDKSKRGKKSPAPAVLEDETPEPVLDDWRGSEDEPEEAADA